MTMIANATLQEAMLLLISSMSNILSARDHMHVEYCGIFRPDRGAQGSEPKYSKCKNATMIGKSSITIKMLIGNQSSITIAYNSMRIYIYISGILIGIYHGAH